MGHRRGRGVAHNSPKRGGGHRVLAREGGVYLERDRTTGQTTPRCLNLELTSLVRGGTPFPKLPHRDPPLRNVSDLPRRGPVETNKARATLSPALPQSAQPETPHSRAHSVASRAPSPPSTTGDRVLQSLVSRRFQRDDHRIDRTDLFGALAQPQPLLQMGIPARLPRARGPPFLDLLEISPHQEMHVSPPIRGHRPVIPLRPPLRQPSRSGGSEEYGSIQAFRTSAICYREPAIGRDRKTKSHPTHSGNYNHGVEQIFTFHREPSGILTIPPAVISWHSPASSPQPRPRSQPTTLNSLCATPRPRRSAGP